MNKASLEESLALLAPDLVKEKKKLSPVRVPDFSGSDLSNLLRDEKEESEGEISPSPSPVRSVTSESDENESEEERSERDLESPEVISESEDESEDVSEESDYESEEDELEHEEITISEKRPLTPTKLNFKFGKSPKRLKDVKDIKMSLENLRYQIMKFIFEEDENTVRYVICFDPNGEMVFVDLTREKTKIFDQEKIIKVTYKDDDSNITGSYMEKIKNRLTFEVYGVVFYDGVDYYFLKRNEEGSLVEEKYTTVDGSSDDPTSIPYTYAIIKYKDILDSPVDSIKRTKMTYQVIQNCQMEASHGTISSLFKNLKTLTETMQKFEQIYNKSTQQTISDWKNLSGSSMDYYQKFSEGTLTDDEKSVFDKISVNMFARFQLFNDQVDSIDSLGNVVDRIQSCTYNLKKVSEKLESKSDRLANNFLEIKDLELYI